MVDRILPLGLEFDTYGIENLRSIAKGKMRDMTRNNAEEQKVAIEASLSSIPL